MNKTPELYDQWNEQKKKVEFRLRTKKVNVDIGEIWRYYEGMNIGNELSKGGKFLRPCIILKNNLHNGLVCIAPLTTKFHDHSKSSSIDIINPYYYNLKPSRILLGHIHLIDKKRLQEKISSKKISQGFVEKILYQYYNLLTKNTP